MTILLVIIHTQGDERTARQAEKDLYAKAEKESRQDPLTPKNNRGQQGAPTKRKGGSADKENKEPALKKKTASKAKEPKAVKKVPARKRGKLYNHWTSQTLSLGLLLLGWSRHLLLRCHQMLTRCLPLMCQVPRTRLHRYQMLT